MQQRLGERYPAFLASYENPPVKGLRVNTLKLSPAAFEAVAPAEFRLGEKIGSCGFYTEGEKLGADPYHFAGLYYLQEPSAMTVGETAGTFNMDRVLDLCAAPGGKTTHIAQKMGGKGILIANEIDFSRAKILSENVERMGISNCAVLSASPETLAEKFSSYFGLILVDAPCSGEGMFKKEENAIPAWSEENVQRCAVRQKRILGCAAEMLEAGGRLVYSTCTFAEEEDEWQIEEFLREHPDFVLVEMKKLYPHEYRGEGHFAAVLQKVPTPLPAGGTELRSIAHPERSEGSHRPTDFVQGDASASPQHERQRGSKPFPILKNAAAERAFNAFCADFFADGFVPVGLVHTLADGRMYLIPAGMPNLSGAHLLRVGVELGTWDGKLFKPAHALVMAFGSAAKRKLSLTREEAKTYLRGEALSRDMEKGWCAVCVDGYPLGLGKSVGGTVKNHYPKGLRLRS